MTDHPEPKREIPPDYDSLSPWFAIIRRANHVIVRGAVQWVEIIAYIDEQGQPRLHGSPEVMRELSNDK